MKKTGRLRERVTIQKPTESSADAYGATTDTWSDLVTTKAEVLTLTSREAFYAAQVQPEAAVSVLIRYNADVDSTMRVKFGDRYLYIDSVVSDARRFETRILCHEAL